jgi:ElaB/YqjD/DUF883 family membrane-anchored ribosome-binding protein
MADDLNRGRDIRVAHDHHRTGSAELENIRDGIGNTRERMSQTIDEIGDRLNPGHIKAQVKQNLRDATIGRAETMARHAADRVNDTRTGMMDTIRDNPIPAAMVGIGLGWLMWNGKREGSQGQTRDDRDYRDDWYMGERDTATAERMRARFGGVEDEGRGRVDQLKDEARHLTDRAEGMLSDATDRARDAVDRTQETLYSATDRAQDLAVEMADKARYRAHRVEDRFQEGLHESPLAMGAAAVAIGLAAGLTVPSTRTESQLMGRSRDRVVDRMRGMAEETGERVQNVASQVMDQTKDTVRTAAREEGLTANSQSRSGQNPQPGQSSQSRSSTGLGGTTPAPGMAGSANTPGQTLGTRPNESH